MSTGTGPLTAPLWLIGPAAETFDGQPGNVLRAALRTAGIALDSVRMERFNYGEIAATLHTHRPKVIVAFGADVCARLIGEAWPSDGVYACRGYLWDTPYGRVLSAVTPEAAFREWTPWRALLDMDLRKARVEVELGAPPLAERVVHVVTSQRDLSDLKRAISGAAFLSTDIENTHDLALACVGFAPTPAEAWVIPAVEGWQLDAIRELCEGPVPKVLQNGQYDRLFLKLFAGITLRAQAFDTMLAWHAINPEMAGKKTDVGHKKARARRTAKSLAFLISIYERTRWHKNYDFTSEMERYVLCGYDVCSTLSIALKQMAQLEAL